jgi:hypothetical protein
VHLDEPGQEVLPGELDDSGAARYWYLGPGPTATIQPFLTTTVASGSGARSVPSMTVAPRRTSTGN